MQHVVSRVTTVSTLGRVVSWRRAVHPRVLGCAWISVRSVMPMPGAPTLTELEARIEDASTTGKPALQQSIDAVEHAPREARGAAALDETREPELAHESHTSPAARAVTISNSTLWQREDAARARTYHLKGSDTPELHRDPSSTVPWQLSLNKRVRDGTASTFSDVDTATRDPRRSHTHTHAPPDEQLFPGTHPHLTDRPEDADMIRTYNKR